MTMTHPVPFDVAADRFRSAGFVVENFGEAIWRFCPRTSDIRMQLMVSAGIHGNETAPVEMLAELLTGWQQAPGVRNVDLLLCVGNLAAIATNQRYVHSDLNRQFFEDNTGDEKVYEVGRAKQLMAAARRFFARGLPSTARRWHLDLHTAIKTSLFSRFAVIPRQTNLAGSAEVTDWLEASGLDCIVFSDLPATTFTAFTADLGAATATVELGRAGQFGSNDLSVLRTFSRALDELVRTGTPPRPTQGKRIPRFRVITEIIKQTPRFRLFVPEDAANFTALAEGQLIAEDEGVTYRAQRPEERIIFPNPNVALGQRAGLLVAPIDRE